MNLEHQLKGMPTEKLLKLMREAAAEYDIPHHLMPPRNASSADIIIMIEDLESELGLAYDPEQKKICDLGYGDDEPEEEFDDNDEPPSWWLMDYEDDYTPEDIEQIRKARGIELHVDEPEEKVVPVPTPPSEEEQEWEEYRKEQARKDWGGDGHATLGDVLAPEIIRSREEDPDNGFGM